MNIGIDVSLLKINLAGMGVYVKEMIEKFSSLDNENHYFLFTNADFLCEISVGANFEVVKNKVKPHILWLKVVLPFLLKKNKIDVFWQPDHILPIKVKGIKYYVTIHDLSGYKLQNVALKKVEIVSKLFMKKTCKDASKIITISEYTKRDIIDCLSVDPEKIEVIYNGDSPYKKPTIITKEQNEVCKKKYNIKKPYFLFVGTINPRKNVLTIVKAFNKTKVKKDSQLVIVGEYGWNSQDVRNEIEKSEYKDDIIVTGYVSESEKEILYRNASCFVFPSILEGFGLPILEAMSVGIPVITSNVSSLPEVGGDAAIYLSNYNDSDELSQHMIGVLDLSDEKRKEIAQKGIEQANKFSREECAEKTLKLITA